MEELKPWRPGHLMLPSGPSANGKGAAAGLPGCSSGSQVCACTSSLWDRFLGLLGF